MNCSEESCKIPKSKRVFRWPDSAEPREITVIVQSWVGIAPDAKHYDIVVKEQGNYRWCDCHDTWIPLICEKGMSDFFLKARVIGEKCARQVVKDFVRMIERSSGCQNHRVVLEGELTSKILGKLYGSD
jgi:hypothetical protein